MAKPAGDQAEAILDAVVVLLVETGFKRLTMDAVASRARVSKQTIYRRWRSQAELVVAAVRSLAAPDEGLPDTGTLHGDVMELLHGMRAELVDNDYLSIVALLSLSRQADRELDAALSELSMERRRPFCEVARRAVERGELLEDDLDAVVDSIVGGIFLRHLFLQTAVADTDLEAIVSTVLSGVRSGTVERAAAS